MRPWNLREDAILKGCWRRPDYEIVGALAEGAFFRSEHQVQARRTQLGLIKPVRGTDEVRQEMAERNGLRQRGWPPMYGTQAERDADYQEMLQRALNDERAKAARAA